MNDRTSYHFTTPTDVRSPASTSPAIHLVGNIIKTVKYRHMASEMEMVNPMASMSYDAVDSINLAGEVGTEREKEVLERLVA